MTQLTSHQKYTLYKHCLSLGLPDDIAVKIREQSHSTLEDLLKCRTEYFTEVEDIIYSAFSWNYSEEGFQFWSDFVDEFTSKGESK